MTLPAVAVALGFIGAYSRYLRSALIVTLDAPYTVVARGKGLPERLVVRRYALRNALVPFTTVIALDFGAALRRLARRRLRVRPARARLALPRQRAAERPTRS